MFDKIIDQFKIDFFRYKQREYFIFFNVFVAYKIFRENFCIDYKYCFS